MNNNREFTLTLRSLLIIILVTVIVLCLAIWFVAHRLEQDRVELDEPIVTVTPSPTPVPTPVPTDNVFDNSLTSALTVVAALTDNDTTNDNVTDSLARNNFLKILVSQIGSTGEILGGQMSTFAYYTEWYIGGYEGNTGWSEETPWCASYISWCLAQVNLSLTGEIPRYANVDNFYNHFPIESWGFAGSKPTPGDIVFFGLLGDPNHMGVVIAADDNYIYTIEGNANDAVGIRKYAITDQSILGYGLLNWVN